MQVIVLHKRQMSETETVIDICISARYQITGLPFMAKGRNFFFHITTALFIKFTLVQIRELPFPNITDF